MRWHTAGILIALSLACAPSQRPVAEVGASPSILSLVAPNDIGTYRLIDRQDSGSPIDGVAHRYSSPPGEHWTAYFYRPDRDDSSNDPEALLDLQLALFKQALEHERAHGVYDRYQIAVEAPDPIRASGNVLPGRKLAYVFDKGEARFVSVLFLYAVRDGCVKIRGTVESAAWEKAQPTFPRDFIKALLSQNYPL
jgi:hypothetical protein